ncbi:MFS transporter [Bacillus sp. YC2]|uniref:MFS transporter n=1 Tax=Bacillus sp. YC2 TaxID=2861287 RepID=UPI001CA765DE|nr:MFS transporter [Bacillus sp. YC2]MBY8914364.1 MFS transporter [Bacillus sp. YC2]
MPEALSGQQSQKWAISLFTIGVFMAALDNGIISAALTTINSSFDVSPSWGSWGVTLYTLGLSVSVPIVGKLSDRYGRKKLFMIEVGLFGLGSLLVALSQSFPMFLAARLIQALGGGGIFIIGSSHILAVLPKEKQGKALGLLGAMNGMAAVLGPNIGSFLLDWSGSWHWLFLINLPIAAALVVFGGLFIAETKEPETKRLDFIGAMMLSLAILSCMIGITNLDGAALLESLENVKVFGFIAAGALLFFVMLRYEKRVESRGGDPILAYSLLQNKVFQWTLVIGFLSGGLLAAVIFIPSYAEQYLHVSAEKAGYWMTPLALASGIGAWLGGALTDKKGPVFSAVLSGLIASAGFSLFPLWVTEKWEFVIASVIAGIGFGFLLGAPLNVLVSETAGAAKGTALGTLSLVRQVGLTLAPTLYAGFITAGFDRIGDDIRNRLDKSGFPADQAHMPDIGGGLSSIQEQVSRIPLPAVKKAVADAVEASVASGYHHLYAAAAVISFCTIVSACILAFFRKSALSKTNASPSAGKAP